MTPVLQTIEGPNGNCYAACLASLLDIPLDQVPDFGRRGWANRLRHWLVDFGIGVIFRKGDGLPLGEQKSPPAGHAILSHQTLFGPHAVICNGGQIIHDPSPRPLGRPTSPVLLWTILRRFAQ